MNIIDKNFEKSFIVLDFLSEKITHLSLQQKIKTLVIIHNAIDNQIKLYKQEEKFRNEIYKDFKNEQRLFDSVTYKL